MGEEPFYSPREDLEALIAAIGSLETAIVDLESSTRLLSSQLPLPTNEDRVTDNFQSTALDETDTLVDAALSATAKAFVRRISVRVEHADSDMLPSRTSDIMLQAGAETTGVFLADMIFASGGLPIVFGVGGIRYFTKSWLINEAIIPAGEKLEISVHFGNMTIGTKITVFVSYVTEVTE